MKLQSYKELIVWRKGVSLVLEIYKLTNLFPREEIYGLTSQIRRSSVSIPANIDEGSRRGTRKDYRSFLINAFGSGAELETHLLIAKQLPFGKSLDYKAVETLLEEIMKMLNKLISQLSE